LKKTLSVLILSMLFCSVAVASPLTDYSQGEGSIDLTWRNTQNTISFLNYSYDFNKKYNLDGMLTFGLGNNFAIQYRRFAPISSDTIPAGSDTGTLKLTTNEFNVLYKLNKQFSALVGFVNAKGDAKDNTNPSGGNIINTKNLWQVGVVGSTAIADKTTLWGSAAVGKDLTNYEIGIGYEFSPNWEFNVNYRDVNVKDMNISSASYGIELKAKGLGYGITYKF